MSALAKLTSLRALLQKHALAAYIVPTADAHQSEYVAPTEMRRAYISDFTGSAGTAVITSQAALLWTDGRYFLQAGKQLDGTCWTLMKDMTPGCPKIEEWLGTNLHAGSFIGFDPKLMSASEFTRMNSFLKTMKLVLKPIQENLIDAIWPIKAADAPKQPSKPILVQSVQYAGISAKEKLTALQSQMKAKDVCAVIVCALDEVAWLLNLRGSDVPYNPVFASYVIVTLDSTTLYVDASKITNEVDAHLKESGVVVKPYDAVFDDVQSLGKQALETKRQVETKEDGSIPKDASAHYIWMEGSKANYAIHLALADATECLAPATIGNVPIALPKAIKNKAEIDGMKACHIRDGVAVSKFLAWLETQLPSLPTATATQEEIRKSPLNEYNVTQVLKNYRAQQDMFMDLSFETISSIGPNAAVIHYSPSEDKSSPLTTGRVFLLDSGGQYRDGTTDITRTIFLARPGAVSTAGDEDKETDAHPSAFQKEMYTRVLQGHIRLCSQIFPPNTRGPALDVLARAAIWDVGLDYLHGTGHGVGSFLNVHEGPQGISPSYRIGTAAQTPLAVGMVLSNEPGYYRDGEFGFRIENLVHVVSKGTKYGKEFLGFENLTCVPIDRSLIDVSLLNDKEVQWVNEYHAWCRAMLVPLVENDQVTKTWILKNTEPLK